MIKVIFDHSESDSENISTFFFKPEKAVDYTAGQYVELTLQHVNPDHRGQKRWFTLSSSPSEELISITTKINPEKSSSFKQALRKLLPGQELVISEPMGDFVLPKLIQTPLLFVAGGIGITPYHSMLSWLSSTLEKRPIKLIYAVNTENDIIFLDTFQRAEQHVTIVVDKPSTTWGGERGQLSAEMIVGLANPSPETLIYISGPETMIEKLEKDFLHIGTPKRQLVLDYFPNYPGI